MNFTRDNLRAYASGRWGRRRVRVSECRVIRAETVYDEMIWLGRSWKAGARGEFYIGGHLVSWESLENRIWACGRLFLRCRRCDGRTTRLYVPKAKSCEPGCRGCWGLTYTTRTLRSYKRHGGGLLRAFGVTPGDWTRMDTAERRAEARQNARARYAERRLFRLARELAK